MNYTMLIEPAKDAKGVYYAASFPDLPGCTTLGDTLEELRENAQEAVALYIDTLVENGRPVPEPAFMVETLEVKAS